MWYLFIISSAYFSPCWTPSIWECHPPVQWYVGSYYQHRGNERIGKLLYVCKFQRLNS
jgi:hypothetical protein